MIDLGRRQLKMGTDSVSSFWWNLEKRKIIERIGEVIKNCRDIVFSYTFIDIGLIFIVCSTQDLIMEIIKYKFKKKILTKNKKVLTLHDAKLPSKTIDCCET
jgi:hypothetical protein